MKFVLGGVVQAIQLKTIQHYLIKPQRQLAVRRLYEANTTKQKKIVKNII